MSLLRKLAIISILPIALALQACGSSSATDGGIGGTGVSVGEITKIGSITVNGVRFDTANAQVFVEGNLEGVGDNVVTNFLTEGLVVRAEGRINADGVSGTADRVYFNDNVEGPVAAGSIVSKGANAKQLVILGQTVTLDDRTKYEPADLFTAVADGNVLEVSGLMNPDGSILATHAERKADSPAVGDVYEVKGLIGSVNAGAGTFTINGLTVDYNGADISDLGAGPTVGLNVEVKGTLNGSVLEATVVEREAEVGDISNADEAEIEGFVTNVDNFGTNGSFTLGTIVVQTNGSTRYEGGLAVDILIGARLEVEGSLVNGVLIADEISFEDDIELRSAVFGTGATDITLEGLNSLTIETNDLTEFDGDRANLGTIAQGDYAKIRGRMGTGNTIIANRVETEASSSKNEVEIQGPVADFNAGLETITLMGFVVDASGGGITFVNANEQVVSSTTFFNALKTGDIVNANGTLDGTQPNRTPLWDEIELEDED